MVGVGGGAASVCGDNDLGGRRIAAFSVFRHGRKSVLLGVRGDRTVQRQGMVPDIPTELDGQFTILHFQPKQWGQKKPQSSSNPHETTKKTKQKRIDEAERHVQHGQRGKFD